MLLAASQTALLASSLLVAGGFDNVFASVLPIAAHRTRRDLASIITASSTGSGPQFSANTLNLVEQRLTAVATHSWEIGTMETALLELHAPNAFLYQNSTIPPRIESTDNVTATFASVDAVMRQKPTGILPFFKDGAAGDPASVGIPVLIKNWTQPSAQSPTNVSYAMAATQQLQYLLTDVPRYPNGAISQRAPPEPFQAWADYMSMAPPFIAYYGALQQDRSLLDLAYTQIQSYRELLLDESGLLQHIVLGNTGVIDHGHWATGHGWFASGSIRVLRAIQLSSEIGPLMLQEQSDILLWTSTLLSRVWSFQNSDGSLQNYLDGKVNGTFTGSDGTVSEHSPSSVFPESSGTALLAAASYRLATLLYTQQDGILVSAFASLLATPSAASEFHSFSTSFSPSTSSLVGYYNSLVASAEKARGYIVGKVDTSTGWLNGVVDPEDWFQPGEHSPEGQAFVLMMQAAYRDWLAVTQGNGH